VREATLLRGRLQADDRLLLITEGNEAAGGAAAGLAAGARRGAAESGGGGGGRAPPQAADLGVVHLRLPAQYLAANWPLSHAALSADGMDIAVSGRHGLALYSRRSARWRLFGDVSQEREIAVHVRPETAPLAPRVMTVLSTGVDSRIGQADGLGLKWLQQLAKRASHRNIMMLCSLKLCPADLNNLKHANGMVD